MVVATRRLHAVPTSPRVVAVPNASVAMPARTKDHAPAPIANVATAAPARKVRLPQHWSALPQRVPVVPRKTTKSVAPVTSAIVAMLERSVRSANMARTVSAVAVAQANNSTATVWSHLNKNNCCAQWDFQFFFVILFSLTAQTTSNSALIKKKS